MLVDVNGRTRFFNRVESVKKLRPGRFVAHTTIGDFEIEGGKAAGGSRTDWFVEGFGDKAIRCNSLVDALRTIDNA